MSTRDDLAALDAVASAELVHRGDATPTELVEAAIARIEALNPTLNAVIHERFDAALAEADEVDRTGPLAGVPVLIKDMDGMLAGEPFHQGTRHLLNAGYRAPHTSVFFQRMIDAGAVVLGKTNCPELGLVVTTEPETHGPSRNPWNTDHSTGGSSGGSAAAVASGMVPVAHAGDGGGSIRIPASECGLVGLKPSRGRSTMAPTTAEVWRGLVLWFAVSRSVRDTATLLDVVRGPAPGDPYHAPPPSRAYGAELGADPGRLRLGFRDTLPVSGDPVDADVSRVLGEALALLESVGHDVAPGGPAGLDDDQIGMHFLNAFGSWVAREVEELGELTGTAATEDTLEPATWAIAQLGRDVTSTQYLAALESLDRFSRGVCSWWVDHDILVTPTLPEPPPPLGYFAGTPDDPLAGMVRAASLTGFTMPFNITGQPSMSLPLGWSSEGLPIGVQFTAAYGREDLLIRLASQIEGAAPWAGRRPPVWP